MSMMTDRAAEIRLISGGLGSLPHVNLLPPEIAEAARFRKVQLGLGGLVLLAAAGVGLLFVNANSSVGTAQEQVATASAEQTRLQTETKQYAEVTATFQKADAAKKLLSSAMGPEVRYSRFMNDLGLTIPDHVWLTSATYVQAPGTPPLGSSVPAIGTVTFVGKAFEHKEVATWLDSLAAQEGFSDPQLQSSVEGKIGGRAVVDWTATVNISDAAYSGRFLTRPGA